MKNLFLTIAVACMLPVALNAQKLKLTKGNLAPLKAEKEMMIEFDYSSFSVGKFKNEADYKAKKIQEYNEKEAGRGDSWSESWERDKEVRYQDKFIALFNKGSQYPQVSKTADNAKYKLIVVTTFIEPGFNVGVAKKPASANMIARIVETDNPSNVVAEVTITGAPGSQAMGFDYDTGTRISECYAISAKRLAALMNKILKKA